MRADDAPFNGCPIAYPTTDWRCKVIRAVDGDTAIVAVDLGFFRSEIMDIRYASIDCFESRGDFPPEHLAKGHAAFVMNAQLITGKWALLKTRMDHEKYGRILGDLYVYSDPDDTHGAALTDVSYALRQAGFDKLAPAPKGAHRRKTHG